MMGTETEQNWAANRRKLPHVSATNQRKRNYNVGLQQEQTEQTEKEISVL